MSLQASFSHIDRHAAWGARPASVVVLLGLGLLVGVGAVFAPNRAGPEAGLNPAAISGSFTASPCLPHDAALGNEGGDPYAFYVFNREEELARHRAASCDPVVAQAPSRERRDRQPPALGNFAQFEPAHVPPNAP